MSAPQPEASLGRRRKLAPHSERRKSGDGQHKAWMDTTDRTVGRAHCRKKRETHRRKKREVHLRERRAIYWTTFR